MGELKTKKTNASVPDHIAQIQDAVKRADGERLLEIFATATGMEPALWGTSIIGYGQYHYKSERSTQEGDWPLTGFAMRKAAISVYIMPGINNYPQHLAKIGKHKASKGSCLYIKKLSDIDTDVLTQLIRDSVADMDNSE